MEWWLLKINQADPDFWLTKNCSVCHLVPHNSLLLSCEAYNLKQHKEWLAFQEILFAQEYKKHTPLQSETWTRESNRITELSAAETVGSSQTASTSVAAWPQVWVLIWIPSHWAALQTSHWNVHTTTDIQLCLWNVQVKLWNYQLPFEQLATCFKPSEYKIENSEYKLQWCEQFRCGTPTQNSSRWRVTLPTSDASYHDWCHFWNSLNCWNSWNSLIPDSWGLLPNWSHSLLCWKCSLLVSVCLSHGGIDDLWWRPAQVNALLSCHAPWARATSNLDWVASLSGDWLFLFSFFWIFLAWSSRSFTCWRNSSASFWANLSCKSFALLYQEECWCGSLCNFSASTSLM